jgi:ADP-heptose:LPS heptosyltransferase
MTGHPWVLPAIEASEDGLFDHPIPYPWPGQPDSPVEIRAHAVMVEHITGGLTGTSDLLPEVQVPVQDGDRCGPPTLVLVPWGSGGVKTLTCELIAGVVEQLPDRSRCGIRIVAEPRRRREQARLTRELSSALPGFDVAPAPGGDLRELYLTIGRATAVMTADTFPAHLAIAMDKPVAVLATGALHGVFGPWSRSPRQRWFCREMDCWGCGWRCPYPEPPCLLEVDKKEVAAFLAPYLAGDEWRLREESR